MLGRSVRLVVLTAMAAVSVAGFCGVAYADDNDEDDNSYRSRGGIGGEPGENSAECELTPGPGSAPKQCRTPAPQRGADGPDRIVF